MTKAVIVYAHGVTVEVIDRADASQPPPPPPPPPPTTAVRPVFKITAPLPGTIAGTADVLFANLKNVDDGPATLYVDGVARATSTIASGRFVGFNFDALTNTPHSLHVVGTEPSGMAGESASVTVLPTAGIALPTNSVPPLAYMNSPYLYFFIPATGTANQSYERFQLGSFVFKGTVQVVVRCQISGGSQTTLAEPVQLLLDNQPFGPFVTPVANVATFQVDSTLIAKGSHALSARQQMTQRWCEAVLIDVNQDGVPLTGPRDVWVCPVWFDQEYTIVPSNLGPFKVTYPGVQPQFAGDPITFPLRTHTPWTTYLPSSQLWAEAVCINVPTGWPRRFKQTNGAVDTCNDMQYPHASMERTEMPIYDGNRGVAGFGHAWAGQTNPVTGGVYGISTQGRLWYLHMNGRLTTIAGKRKPIWFTGDRAEFELAGNFVDAPVGFNEPWGYAHDPRDTAEPNNWLSHIVSDSFNHRLSLVNNGNARLTVGQSNITTLVGKAGAGFHDGDAATAAMTYTPWGSVVGPDGKLYWAEHDSDYAAIRRLDFATMLVDTPWRSPVPNPTKVGKPANRVIPALAVGGQIIKGIDGPFGSATGYYFQSIDFDSKGRLIVAEKFTQQGGGAVRRIDFTLQTVTTLYVIPMDGNTRDVTICVNKDGTCGALDTIYGTVWGRSFLLTPNPDDTYSFRSEILRDEADGSWHNAVLEGQGNHVVGVSYTTLVTCANGQLTMLGTGAESGFRITKQLPTDPVINSTKLQSGMTLFKSIWGFRHGIRGQDTLEGNGFAQIRQFDDATLAVLFRSGWSLGYPVTLTDANVSDLIYAIRWPKV